VESERLGPDLFCVDPLQSVAWACDPRTRVLTTPTTSCNAEQACAYTSQDLRPAGTVAERGVWRGCSELSAEQGACRDRGSKPGWPSTSQNNPPPHCMNLRGLWVGCGNV